MICALITYLMKGNQVAVLGQQASHTELLE